MYPTPTPVATKSSTSPSSARNRSTIGVRPGPDAFEVFDGFIRSITYLSDAECLALIVTGDEIMDNLLTHSEVGHAGIEVLVRKRASGLTLAFFVESHPEFADFSSSLDSGEPLRPRFDQKERRWRGLGMTMCRNIATTVRYRPGSTVDRVLLTFDAAF